MATARRRARPAPGDGDRDDVARLAGGSGAGGPTSAIGSAGGSSAARGGWLASFGLGAIFAVGWTPCIGIILGGILTWPSTSGPSPRAGLLIAYTLGLGIPFLLIAVLYDRAPGLIRPLIRHGRAVSIVGGLLVVAIGVAMIMDWLACCRAPSTSPASDVTERPSFTHKREQARADRPVQRPPDARPSCVAVVVVAIGLVSDHDAARHDGPEPARRSPGDALHPRCRRRGPAARRPAPGARRSPSTTARPPLTDLDGNPIRLEDLRGKAVWVNFWATWCPPCQSETPILRDVASATATGASRSSASASRRRAADVPAYAERYRLELHDRGRCPAHDLPTYRRLGPADLVLHRPGRRHPLRRSGTAHGRGVRR